jgi:hypothetical protein
MAPNGGGIRLETRQSMILCLCTQPFKLTPSAFIHQVTARWHDGGVDHA